MALTRDIAAMYRGPRRVMRRLLALAPNEGRVLAILMGACVVLFIAQWPRLSREAFETGRELEPLLGGALLALVFIAPLGFYLLALLSYWVLRLFRWTGSAYDARLSLFWALLAAAPLALLRGLVVGFVGPGPGLNIVDLLWVGVFVLFWGAGLKEAGRRQE